MRHDNTYKINLVYFLAKLMNMLGQYYLIIISAVCHGLVFFLYKCFKKEIILKYVK